MSEKVGMFILTLVLFSYIFFKTDAGDIQRLHSFIQWRDANISPLFYEWLPPDAAKQGYEK